MLRQKRIGAFEIEVIRFLEDELGRSLPFLDELDENSFGIVESDQHVIALALQGSFLERLPENIGHLSKLKILNLKGCRLDRLPESIGELGQLRTLGLRSNRLTSLPETIGNLHELRALSLSENRLISLPESLGDLINLRELILPENELTFLPATIGKLASLQLLSLSENKLKTLPEEIGSLLNLKEFYASGNELTCLPGSIAKLTALQKLDLDGNPLDQASVQAVKVLASSGCLVSLPKENPILARMAKLVSNPGGLAETPSGEDIATAMKAVFISLIPYYECVRVTYEEDFCVSEARLSRIEATDWGIKSLVTFQSGYEEPGKEWDFFSKWDNLIFTASKWFILHIGTFTFHNSHMSNYDYANRGINETNKMLGIDRTIARVERPMNGEYWGKVGTEYWKAGRFPEAEAALKKALELDPTSAQAWGQLGLFFNNQGRKQEALEAMEKAIHHAPAGWRGFAVMQKYRSQLMG